MKLQMEIKALASPIKTISTNPNPDNKQIALGQANGMVHVFQYGVEQNQEFEPYLGEITRVAKE